LERELYKEETYLFYNEHVLIYEDLNIIGIQTNFNLQGVITWRTISLENKYALEDEEDKRSLPLLTENRWYGGDDLEISNGVA